MKRKVAVILAGCGNLDGSEIYETVVSLLCLDRAGVEYQCFAPDIPQKQVLNYLTQEVMPGEVRNVLVEAARLARGNIQDIQHADPAEFDAAVFPGGYGVAQNLSSFAMEGAESQLQPEVAWFAKQMAQARKPMAFLCIAPTLIPQIYDEPVNMTIGVDKDIAQLVEQMGAKHVPCTVRDYVVDVQHKVVSTPAFMFKTSISEVAAGIEGAITALLRLI